MGNNRGVRCYKLMYEALYHLLIQQMETHYIKGCLEQPIYV